MAEIGTIYLLHLAEKVGSGANHYLGWSTDVEKRVEKHLAGRGNALIRVAVEQDVDVSLVKTWPDKTRHDERKMKKQGHLAQHCPECREAWKAHRNKLQNARRAKHGRADRPRGNPRGPLHG